MPPACETSGSMRGLSTPSVRATSRRPFGSQSIEAVQPGSYDIVTAFEVVEHFAHPETELAGLFRLAPQVLITSTQPYEGGMAKDWWYIGPETGQHVFFYSHKALHQIAARFGYHLYEFGSLQVFSRSPLSSLQQTYLRAGLSQKGRRLMRMAIEARSTTKHISHDHQVSVEMDERKPSHITAEP